MAMRVNQTYTEASDAILGRRLHVERVHGEGAPRTTRSASARMPRASTPTPIGATRHPTRARAKAGRGARVRTMDLASSGDSGSRTLLGRARTGIVNHGGAATMANRMNRDSTGPRPRVGYPALSMTIPLGVPLSRLSRLGLRRQPAEGRWTPRRRHRPSTMTLTLRSRWRRAHGCHYEEIRRCRPRGWPTLATSFCCPFSTAWAQRL